MKRSLSVLAVVLACLFSLEHDARGADKPNVVMICIDDLNDWLGCMGNTQVKSPNIDKLANSGVLFKRAYCQFPVCGPSRASILSGMLPSTLRFGTHPSPSSVAKRVKQLNTSSIYTYFREHGYYTMGAGKIQHSRIQPSTIDKTETSFDKIRYSAQGEGPRSPKVGYEWGKKYKFTMTDWGYAGNDESMHDFIAAKWATDQLQKTYDKPFFLMVGFARPHAPWLVPKKWFDLYENPKQLNLPPYKADDLDDVPAISKQINIWPGMPATEWAIKEGKWHDIIHAYLASISFVDAQVGTVMSALENSPYADNTIVVLWSDHGYFMGEKGTTQKHNLWERSAHVPFIITGPQVSTKACSRVVGLVDLYPTLVEMCGLPENKANEGRSLVPLLKDVTTAWDYPTITTWLGNNHAIQTERYRYMRYEDGSEELYDHQADPNEWTNLATEEQYTKVKQKLAAACPADAKFDSTYKKQMRDKGVIWNRVYNEWRRENGLEELELRWFQ